MPFYTKTVPSRQGSNRRFHKGNLTERDATSDYRKLDERDAQETLCCVPVGYKSWDRVQLAEAHSHFIPIAGGNLLHYTTCILQRLNPMSSQY
jgi:hypothetical protein